VTLLGQHPVLTGLELTGQLQEFYEKLEEVAHALPGATVPAVVLWISIATALLLIRRYLPWLWE
jgi:hypothetical protein